MSPEEDAGSAGLSVLLLNALYRVGVSGDVQRDREAEARDYFERHGRWPDEEPAQEAAGPTGRRWRLPEGVATPETEAEEARRKAGDSSLHGGGQGDH